MRVWFQNKSIFKKLLITFALVVIIPQAFSFYIAQRTASNLIVYQIMSETDSSLMLVANSMDTLLQRAYSMALYVSNNEGVQLMLIEAERDASNFYGLEQQELQLRQLERINYFNRFINNLAFNMIEVRAYITIITSNQQFINWTYTGQFSESYFRYMDEGTNRIWTIFEPNYVSVDSRNLPYVWTIGKNIIDPITNTWQGAFVISIPERSIASLLSADNLQSRIVVDENNRIISSTRPELLGTCFNTTGQDPNMLISHVPLRSWQIVDIKYYDVIANELNVARYNLLATVILSMAAFAVVAAFIAKGISKPLEKRFAEDARAKREAELKALQAQISPHFLFNTLNCIRWAAFNNHNKKAADMTLALSNLLRMTIINGSELISLETEVANLFHYVTIFQMSQEKEFTFSADIPEELKTYQIPRLLLQPIVENSLIHGLNDTIENGKILVTAKTKEDGVYIIIQDNGSGIDTNKPVLRKGKKLSGIGVDNVNERIKLNYGTNYGLTIESEVGQGTMVQLFLPSKSEVRYD